MGIKLYKTVYITQIPLDVYNEEAFQEDKFAPDFTFSVQELLEFTAGMPLEDQCLMFCNVLTVSGFSQKEIAEAVGMKYGEYRQKLLQIRERYKDNLKNRLVEK